MAGSARRRRRFLTRSGGALALGFAGCLGGTDETADTSDDDGGDDTGDSDDTKGEAAGGDAGERGDLARSYDHTVGQPVSKIRVEMISNDAGNHFGPRVVHVETGGTVTWVLESGAHDTTAYHPKTHGDQRRIPEEAKPWGSGLLSEEGDAFERTFDVEGVYDYACTPHESVGMVGTVLVGWPSPDEQPGLKLPSDDRPDAAIDRLDRNNELVRDAL